jgi:hypothetical protein
MGGCCCPELVIIDVVVAIIILLILILILILIINDKKNVAVVTIVTVITVVVQLVAKSNCVPNDLVLDPFDFPQKAPRCPPAAGCPRASASSFQRLSSEAGPPIVTRRPRLAPPKNRARSVRCPFSQLCGSC